jgi:hypothetical protein
MVVLGWSAVSYERGTSLVRTGKSGRARLGPLDRLASPSSSSLLSLHVLEGL